MIQTVEKGPSAKDKAHGARRKSEQYAVGRYALCAPLFATTHYRLCG